MKKALILAAAALSLWAASYRTPAATYPARRTEEGPGTVLPGGRRLAPYGTQFTTGPGPFGLARSADGQRIVTSDAGPDRTALSFLENFGSGWEIRTLTLRAKRDSGDPDEWKSTFMGLAFSPAGTLYASEGESGRVREINPSNAETLNILSLDNDDFDDSYSGDLALDAERGILYVADQANFRVAVFDTRTRRMVNSIPAGRLPFAMALSPDRRRLYVTNIGMFAYQPVPGADAKEARTTGLSFPAFGFPSKEAREGVDRENASGKLVHIPGLGDPNSELANSLAVIDTTDPAHAKTTKFIRTGVPFGPESWGGSGPAGVLATADAIYVTNSVNDSISVINPATLEVTKTIPLRIPGLDQYRGILPIGLAWSESRHLLLVTEGGINAVAAVDPAAGKVIGHIPSGWFPTRVLLDGNTVYVTNAKGHGTGPNATLHEPLPDSFQLDRRKGSISRYELPTNAEIENLTATVFANNGFTPAPSQPLPPAIKYAVIIVKENRTFDEVFGDVAGAPDLARYGAKVTPNHHSLAQRWAMSSNFYADSEVSIDGHHWLVDSYPNAWLESTMASGYAGAKNFRLNGKAPGRLQFPESNSSVAPEDQLEAGTLWHHLERHKIGFRNYGEGFELAGVDEGKGLKPTGGRYLNNIPMPEVLYQNTSRGYPNYNTNIPDQFRATQFIAEIKSMYEKPGKDLPRLLFIHLPDDHTADPRPDDGYPTRSAYVADNDYALGRIMEYLSHTKWWKNMAVFITEDDAGGGVDHVDAHRTVMMVAGPWAKKGYVSQQNSSFPGMLKTVFEALRLPPLNLYDATATSLADCFTNKPDYTPYKLLPADPSVFDPAQAKEPLDPKPGPRMDDPDEVRKEHKRR